MAFGLGVPELAILFVIVVMFFGVGRLPDIGKSLGKSIRDFRSAFRDENKE